MCASSLCNVLTPVRRVFTVCTLKQQYLVLLTFQQNHAGSSEIPACHYFCYPAALFDISVPPYIGQVTHVAESTVSKTPTQTFFRFYSATRAKTFSSGLSVMTPVVSEDFGSLK